MFKVIKIGKTIYIYNELTDQYILNTGKVVDGNILDMGSRYPASELRLFYFTSEEEARTLISKITGE